MPSVTLTIDGRPITVEQGRTVLQAAIEHGFQVPYYCYHPGLGVDGSCRVCIVKIEKMPKLQTACSTLCTEGMVVSTQTPDVVEARASVFEFLLINHPLDCPVCDKGGECPLQDFSYAFGPQQSRMEFPRRVFDGEGVRADVDFGPTLMLNRNRCILCTRCIRFMRDIDGDAQIGIVDRGYGSEIGTFEEQGVHSLLSGNLMDVCPVGAITTRDYRFKSRPWDNPNAADTICTYCAKGCATTVWLKAKPEWARGPRLVRITPRFNPEINGYWMCDIGRFEYHWVEEDRRLRGPFERDDAGNERPGAWPDVAARLAARLAAADAGTLRFLVSAHASHEELFLVRRLAARLAAPMTLSWRQREKEQPPDTKFRIPAVDAPNVTGARDQGLTSATGDAPAPDVSDLRKAVETGAVAGLFVFDPGPEGSLGEVDWVIEARQAGRLRFLVVQGPTATELTRVADVVLAGASSFEKDASYTNERGRVQAASRVLPPPGDAREDWRILAELGAALGLPETWTSSADVRAGLQADLAANAAYADLTRLAFARPQPARNWLQGSNPSERFKWEAMFQDLPPVKGATPVPAQLVNVVPLKLVE
jgi:NADH-quinone oxidoreductase subunit G